MRKIRGVAAVAVAVAVLAVSGIAGAWSGPSTSAEGGACNGDGSRVPITWTVRNNESGNKGSPATIINVHVTVGTTGPWAGVPMPNTGSATATAQTDVPPEYVGEVKLTYTMKWSGSSGGDQKDGSAKAYVYRCEPPETTTTTSTVPEESSTTTQPGGSTSTTVGVPPGDGVQPRFAG